LVTCTGTGNKAYTLPNGNKVPAFPQCQNLCDLVNTVLNVIYIAMAWAIWVIAPIVFIIGGIMYMLAGANPEFESTAKKALTGTVIGLVIILCSYVIIATLVSFLGITHIGGFGSAICP
jgi:uncharacterized membrane protein